jgi:ubiquinone biosynthesis protein UbiJ
MEELLIAICAAVEGGFNTLIDMDPDARRRLSAMQGKLIAVRLKGIDLSLYLLPTDRGIQVHPHYSGEPDTEILGTPMGLLSLGLGNSDAMFEGEVEIRGDVELGQAFKRLLDRLDIDWEEQLSRLTGDALAHHIGRVVRGGLGWGARTLNTLARDVAEYLQEESRDLPTRPEITPLMNGIDDLRDDVDRLEARLTRIRQTLGKEE